MLGKHRNELAGKPVEVVLAYLDCFDELVSLRLDEGNISGVPTFSQFYEECQRTLEMNRQNLGSAYEETAFLNALLDAYGYPGRF